MADGELLFARGASLRELDATVAAVLEGSGVVGSGSKRLEIVLGEEDAGRPRA